MTTFGTAGKREQIRSPRTEGRKKVEIRRPSDRRIEFPRSNSEDGRMRVVRMLNQARRDFCAPNSLGFGFGPELPGRLD